MDNEDLLNEFLIESFENLSSINNDLTRIEKDPENLDLLNNLYRTVHTMKGSASFLGYKKLQDITHSAENLMDELREGKIKIKPQIVDILLSTFDICNLILKNIERTKEEGDVDIKENKSLLDKILKVGGDIEDLNPSATGGEEKLSSQVVESEKSITKDTDNELGGLSPAALESLRELMGDGKIDSSTMDELEESSQESVIQVQPSPDIIDELETSELVIKETIEVSESTSIADSTVRVNVKVLDKIMNIVGELVLNRNQIVQYSNLKSEHEFSRLSQQLNIITSELQSEVMSTRMQPIGSILTKFERLVRDFSRENGKKITLKLSGQETELDKTLIEAIKDPLVHIIRNACDHGLENIEERTTLKKKEEGTILIKSYNESGQVTIEIVDDGRGLDPQKLGRKAVDKGVITQDKFEKMSDLQIYNLIFSPGFSTAEKITNTSGRGVGMDVVKTNIEKIGGSVSVNSELGVRTTFKLRIPLTLAIVPALIIKSRNEAFAIPQLNLVELVRLETPAEKSLLEQIQGSEFLKLRGKLTPVFRLDDKLNLELVNENNLLMQKTLDSGVDSQKSGVSIKNIGLNYIDDAYNIVILNSEENYFGIIVDEILDTEEIVVKPLNSCLKHLNLFGGATIMGDGKVALILDALGFLNTVSNITESNSEKVSGHISDENDVVNQSEKQENLLFTLFDDRDYAIPLSLVSRLEEFDVDTIEKTGDQPIVRYLNAPMPLLNIEKTLSLSGESSLTTYPQTGEKNLSCIVTTIQGKNYGIIVKEVLDISIDEVDIEDTAVDRSGILGTVYINNKTISLIDMYGIINNGSNINLVRPLIANDISDVSRINKKILVVDDSPMFRKMEADLLKSLGYSVETANHGGEGFEKISKNKYDLLITDVEMPILNGYEFAKKIRTELSGNNIPILALTTRFSEEDKKKGKESGFDFHLEKFKKEEVTKKVLEILREN